MTKEQLFDKELDIVHQCLAELYDFQYDNEKERIARIKKALSDIRELYDNNPVMQEGKEENLNYPHPSTPVGTLPHGSNLSPRSAPPNDPGAHSMNIV